MSTSARVHLRRKRRRRLAERDGRLCHYCGVGMGLKKLTVDHVIPRSQGGSTTDENLVLACETCNKAKGDRPLAEFLGQAA